MSDIPIPPEPGGEKPDIFTRLSIAMCPQDDGTRPVNPAWVGSDISFLSPAIQFATFPVPANQPTQVTILINNLGTADACGAWLETAYNLYIGNQAATMVSVENKPLPLIPAGCPHPAQVTWTPPDEFIAHACFHARVFDTFSMLYYPARCLSWDSYINPQAGSHNTIILKIPSPNQAAVITYPAINTSKSPIKPKLLATVIDNRTRLSDLDERFPLPFVPDHLTSTSLLSGEAARVENVYERLRTNAAGGPAPANPLAGFGALGGRTPVLATLRWPRETVNERFVHNRFGFDTHEALHLPGGGLQMRRDAFFTDQPLVGVEICSYMETRLDPNETRLIRLVIPPAEFPPPGRRKKIQVDYQTGDERPVQNFVYLYN